MNEKKSDLFTVVRDPAGLTFATKKEWRPLPVSNLSDLHGYAIVDNYISATCIYILLRYMNPSEWLSLRDNFRLVKVSTDPETKQVQFSYIVITEEQARMIRENQLLFWE